MAKKIIIKDHVNDDVMLPVTRGELVLDSSGVVAFHSDAFLATTTKPGLMSSADKTKLENFNSGPSEYIKSATVSGNTLTLKDNNNKEIKFNDTQPPSLSNYVTLNTDQTISGTKTFTSTSGVKSNYGFYETSDSRLKNIIKPLKVDLDDLSKLSKIYYKFKYDSNEIQHIGMLAQEVQNLYPELVSVDSITGCLSLAYDKLSVIALKCIDVLYDEFKDLKKENEILKARLERIEKLL